MPIRAVVSDIINKYRGVQDATWKCYCILYRYWEGGGGFEWEWEMPCHTDEFDIINMY